MIKFSRKDQKIKIETDREIITMNNSEPVFVHTLVSKFRIPGHKAKHYFTRLQDETGFLLSANDISP